MVKLSALSADHQVSEEELYDSEEYTDTESEISSEDEEDDDVLDETLVERIAALKDMIPLETRQFFSRQFTRISNATWYIKSVAGSIALIITTSAIMVGVPLIFEIERENMYVQYEKEAKLQQQGLQGSTGNVQGTTLHPIQPGIPLPSPIPSGL
jgi:import receptor subunit TOM22